jgi:hypothetical protein
MDYVRIAISLDRENGHLIIHVDGQNLAMSCERAEEMAKAILLGLNRLRSDPQAPAPLPNFGGFLLAKVEDERDRLHAACEMALKAIEDDPDADLYEEEGVTPALRAALSPLPPAEFLG